MPLSFRVAASVGRVQWPGTTAASCPSVCRALPRACTVEEAEGRAAVAGQQALAKVYRGPVEWETDSTALVNMFSPDAPNRSPLYGLILDIKNALSVFADHKVSHVAREGNRVAHELAAEATRSGDQELTATVPVRVQQFVLSECTTA